MDVKPGYKQTEVGVIPDDWDVKVVGEILTLQRGYDLPYGKRMEGNIPIVTSSGVTDYHSEFKVKAPGIVTGRYGTIGETFYINENYWPLNTTLYTKDFHQNHPLFIYYFLKTIDFDSHSGKSGVPGINRNDIHSLKSAFPPTLAEQERIANALSDVDGLIEGLQRLIEKKRLMKQGAMQALLTGRKRLPGFDKGQGYKQTEVGVIPEAWEVITLGEIAKYKNGKAHEQDIRDFASYIVVNSKFISTNGEVKKYTDQGFLLAGKDAILMVMSDVPNGRAIAKCFLVDRDNLYTVNQRVCSLEVTQADSKLIFYKLDRNPFYLQFDDGVKQTNLRKQDVLNCPLALPPTLEEQKAIATTLLDMDAEIEALEAKLAKYRQIKQGMMQELLTGKTRLVEPGVL
jgi:type I restriction enzyme S subunit